MRQGLKKQTVAAGERWEERWACGDLERPARTGQTSSAPLFSSGGVQAEQRAKQLQHFLLEGRGELVNSPEDLLSWKSREALFVGERAGSGIRCHGLVT